MKFLLLGHNGYLGSYLAKYLDCEVATGRWGRGATKDHYDFVINCIAKTDMQWCEDNPLDSLNVNGALVANLVDMYPEAKLINFSSYYVYDVKWGFATEESPLANKSLAYIDHKILGEKWNPNGINFRIGKLFGNPERHQSRLTEYILDNDPLELDEHLFNPCSCKCILNVLRNTDFLSQASGIFNLSNEGVTTPYLYGQFINKYLKLDKQISITTRKPFPNYGNFAMSIAKIQQHCNIEPWQKDMIEYLEARNA